MLLIVVAFVAHPVPSTCFSARHCNYIRGMRTRPLEGTSDRTCGRLLFFPAQSTDRAVPSCPSPFPAATPTLFPFRYANRMADRHAQDEFRLSELFKEQSAIFAKSTEQRNELDRRIKELQHEITVWKKAYYDLSDGDKNVQAYGRDATNGVRTEGSRNTALTLCLIDGDANFFNADLVREGEAGGARAAQLLNRGLGADPPRAAQSWVLVILDKALIRAKHVADGICTFDQFDSFCAGFDGAFPLFSVLDAGTTQAASDMKLKEYLITFARASHILRVFLCGHPERSYRIALRMLQNDVMAATKVKILRGSSPVSRELATITPRLVVHTIPGLFTIDAVTPPQSPHGSSTLASSTASPWLDQPLSPSGPRLPFASLDISPPQSPQGMSTTSPGSLQLDPTLPLSKQNPRPCNWFYLAKCNKSADKCQYSHAYSLTREQVEDMRVRAKRSPCLTTARNAVCLAGDKCILGHFCPNGPSCHYLVEGKCKFTGRDMHKQV